MDKEKTFGYGTFLAAAILAFLIFERTDITGIIVFITVVIITWRVSSNKRNKAKSQQGKAPTVFDAFVPTVKQKTISGSFYCQACGATSVLQDEINPSPKCQYCGSGIPAIQELIDKRDKSYRYEVDREREFILKAEEDKRRSQRLKERLEAEERENIRHENTVYNIIAIVIVAVIFLSLILQSR